MSYLDAFDSELKQASIPRRRRARILAEFADHLHEDPEAQLGTPRELAREFADQMGTRLARVTACRAFFALTVAALALVVMFLAGGRTFAGWVGYGFYDGDPYERWYLPMLFFCAICAQVALATGTLALMRAWRLRHQPVISRFDATILNRRAAVGLLTGAAAMAVMPLTFLGFRHPWYALDYTVDPRSRWMIASLIVGSIAIVGLLSLLPSVLAATRLRPAVEGEAGDLRLDLGIDDRRVTPWRAAFALSAVIVLALGLIGLSGNDNYDGLLRGLCDATACMIGFKVFGTYLGLRTTG